MAKAIPEGFHTLTPHITVRDAGGAIDFYKKALGAELINKHLTPDGRVMHALLGIGDSHLMLNDAFPEWGSHPPQDTAGVTLNIYTENVDELFARAQAAGAKVKMPVMDMFWGDRYGQLIDPYGFHWALATHVRDVTPEEMEQAQKEMAQKMPKSA